MAWEPEYITVQELADYARGNAIKSEAALETAVASASRAVDKAAGRQFGKTDTPEERFYTARWSVTRRAWFVETDDFMESGSMVIHFDSANDGTYSTAVD